LTPLTADYKVFCVCQVASCTMWSNSYHLLVFCLRTNNFIWH